MDINLIEILKHAGPAVLIVTIVMFVLSIWTVYAVIERWMAYSKASRQTRNSLRPIPSRWARRRRTELSDSKSGLATVD